MCENRELLDLAQYGVDLILLPDVEMVQLSFNQFFYLPCPALNFKFTQPQAL
jgi:hypothetical protein